MRNQKSLLAPFIRSFIIIHPTIDLIVSVAIVLIVVAMNSLEVKATSCYTYPNARFDLYSQSPCSVSGCHSVQAKTYKGTNGMYIVNYMNTSWNKNRTNCTPNSAKGSCSDTTSQCDSRRFYSGACTANNVCTFTNT